jgi:RHS repeat-associated protein
VGAAYQQVLPDVDRLYASEAITGSPELRYTISFADAGTYVVWVRGAAVNAAGDSLHLGLNGNTSAGSVQALTGFRFNEWGWSAQTMAGTPATLTIPTPGVYTLTLWAREDGLRVDRLLLTTDTNYTPSGNGPAESPRAGDVLASRLPQPESVVASNLSLNESYVRSQRQQQAWAAFWANLLANPGGLALAPLAFISPLAYNQRRQKKLQGVTAVLLALAIIALGVGLASAGGLGPVAGNPLSVIGNPLSVIGNPPTEYGIRNTEYGLRNTEYALQTSDTTITYTYDDLYRLTNATYDTGQSFAYSYDAAGNRLSHSLDGSTVMTYTYDLANRLVQTHDLVEAVLANYAYDNNGNLLDDGEYTYSYDTANRLTGLADGVSTMSYVYNGDGVRVAQIVDGLRTDYVQDIASPLPQVLSARQGGTMSQYLQGLGLIGEQQGNSPTAWQYHLPDALGSVRQIVDVQGNVTLGREYDPFGGLITDAGSASTNYGFAGEEQDPNTEQIYLRARTYAPNTGRFLQQDSVLGQTNQPRTLHRYTYAFSNPINYTDPSGHMGQKNGGTPPPNSYNNGEFPEPLTGYPGSAQDIPGALCRSVNCGNWQTWSNQAEKIASQGLRAAQCGMAMVIQHLPGLQRIAHGFHSIASQVINTLRPHAGLILGGAIIAGAIILTGGAAIPSILIGAAIGAGIGYGFQVYDNYQAGLSGWDAWSKVDLAGIAQAAFHGAVSGAVAGVLSPALGGIGQAFSRIPGVGSVLSRAAGTTLGRMGITAAVEFSIGRAQRIAFNVVTGGLSNWNDNLWNPRSRDWRREVALDVLPGVGAMMFKPALAGLKGGLSGAVDRFYPSWHITRRLDDFANRGFPINPLNRLKAYGTLASQVIKGAPGAPGRLFSIMRAADRDGWKAYWQAGMQPDYITRLNKFARANELEVSFRASKRMSLFWRLFDLPAKPLDVKDKTRFGVVRDADGVWYRSDMDLAYIKSRVTDQLLPNEEVTRRLITFNEIAAGRTGVGLHEFMHPTHWTYPGVLTLKNPHPGDLWVLNNPLIGSGLVPKNRVQRFAFENNLNWPFDPGYGNLTRVGTGEWLSGAGLRYTLDQNPKSPYTTRIEHVLGHGTDNPQKPVHGVFDDSSQALRLVDEAWHKAHILNIQPAVQGNGNLRYVVPMGRRIGYVGGKAGAATGHPTAFYMILIVNDTNELITAFPHQP